MCNYRLVTGYLSYSHENTCSFVFRYIQPARFLRRLILFLWMATVGAAVAHAADATLTFSEKGYSNGQEVTSVSGTNFTISFNKGTGSTAPKYYNTGTAIRIYGGGYFTVSSSTKTISKIELAFGSGDGSNAITTDAGTYSNGTWSGSAASVKFTVGGTSGHRRLASVAVTYSTSGGGGEDPSDDPAVKTYTLVSLEDIGSTDEVLIVGTKDGTPYAMSNDNASAAPDAVEVTVTGTKVTTSASNIQWNIVYDNGTFTAYPAGDDTKWLYCTNNNNGIRVGTGDNKTFNITDSYIFNIGQSRYLGVYSGQDWRCYTTIHTNIADESFAFYRIQGASVSVTGVSLNQSSKSIVEGDSFTLTATLTPANATNKAVTWTTSNPAVANVVDGVVTGVSAGEATITVTTVDGSFTATCVVTVTALPSKTVTLDAGNGSVAEATLTTVGGKVTLPEAVPSQGCADVGWTFAGWATAEVTETETAPALLTGEYTPASDITLYAVYKETKTSANSDFELVTSDLGTAWAGEYLIAFDDETFADGRIGGTSGMGAENASVNPGTNLDGTTVDGSWGDTYYVTLEEISEGSNTYVLKTQDGKYNYQTSNNNGLASTDNKSTAAAYPITVTFTSSSDVKLSLGGDASGAVFRYNTSGYFRFYKNGGQSAVYLYRRSGSVASYATRPDCCLSPETPLSLVASTEELVDGGEVTLTVSGGNGTEITWHTTDGTLSGQTNSGAMLTLTTPGTYTVTISQEDDEHGDNTICGAVKQVEVTVLQKHTITYKYILDGDGEHTHSTVQVTDGTSYSLPDISDEFTCTGSETFAGWASSSSATAVEAAAGSTQTATADKTWYAVWGEAGAHDETVNVYTLVTDISQLSAGSEVVIAALDYWVVIGKTQNTKNRSAEAPLYDDSDNDNLWFSTAENVAVFTIGGNSTDGYTFFDPSYSSAGGYLYCNTSSSNTLKTETTLTNGTWDITINAGGEATIQTKATTNKYLQYNKNDEIFACYGGTQEPVALFVKTSNTKTVHVAAASSVSTTTSCTQGAVILADNGKWITSSNGQTVRGELNVNARGFDAAATLTATSDNANFTVLLADDAVTASGLATTLTVEYTPAQANVRESATITLTAADVTRQITVNGRSLPDEFVIVSESAGKWYALPANMTGGAGTYQGVEVQLNSSHTQVPTAVSTVIYSHLAVAASRYETSGYLSRLVGNDNKCLWGSKSTNSTDIQNYAQLGNSNGEQYEWLLSTTNGNVYTISLPANADFAGGRQLTTSGTKYGNYKSAGELYLLPVGCSSQPAEIGVTPLRTQVTFTWQSNAESVLVEIRDKATNNLVKSLEFSEVPAIIKGLSEKTAYTYRLVPDGNDNCAAQGEFSTTGPTIDVAEWMEDAIIIQVDKDEQYHPKVIIDGEVESGVEGVTATELFFSKYFEGEGSMKLLGIFNGTRNDIDLDGYVVRQLTNVTSGTKDFDLSTLGSIKAGQEIILFSRPLTSETNLYSCSLSFLNEMSEKSGSEENPRWIECSEGQYFGFPTMNFNGNDALVLLKNGTKIDVFGATNVAPTTKNCRNEVSWSGTVTNMDKDKTIADFPYITGSATLADYNINTTDETIPLKTARCLMFRNKNVYNGEAAVAGNTTSFATMSEWNGRNVCQSGTVTGDLTCNSYQDLGMFDYNTYYREFSSISTTELDDYVYDAEQHLYKIEFDDPAHPLSSYSCLNLRFQLSNPEDPTDIVSERVQQVPIIVAHSTTTEDAIFSDVVSGDLTSSRNRCQYCNVVVLDGATLTKAADGATNDVDAVYNVKVYPGGKLEVPAGTNYSVNSLAMRRQEDAIPAVDLKGTLNVQEGRSVFLDIRIDPQNWHYITLPYDCRVADITFSNGEEADLGTDYLLRWYDGAYRAEHLDGGWTDVSPDATLKKGLGYIIALPGDGRVKRELRLPMAAQAITDEQTDKTVGELYGYGAGKTEEELRWNHRGWNLLGNPYMNYYNASSLTTPLLQGTLEMEYNTLGNWTGMWNLNTEAGKNLRYVVAPINNGWSGYEQREIGDNLEPFTCYFVQITAPDAETPQGISFTRSNVHNRIMAHSQLQRREPVWFGVNMTAADGASDKTALLISDNFTDDYDMMDDLIKMRGSYYKYYSLPVIASRNSAGEMAFNALPVATAANGVPLNFYAPTAGEYTISRNTGYSIDAIEAAWLYDAAEQTWNDILHSDYTFTAARGDNTTRFTLVVTLRAGQSDIVTALENSSDIRVFADERRIVLQELPQGADVWIYSAAGQLINSAHGVAEQYSVEVPVSGVYNVRVSTPVKHRMVKVVCK